jgi:uncharacterized protein (DUF58 family)
MPLRMTIRTVLNERRRLTDRFADWIMRRYPAARHEIYIDRRRIYILPTIYGYYYALALLLMLLGALNYNNSMAFMLTFLLAGLGANAMWHTHRNLLNLTVRKAGVQPVFTGDIAQFRLVLSNISRSSRHALVLQWKDSEPTVLEIPAGGKVETVLRVPAHHRGSLCPGRFSLYSRFPLGLFRAWTWLDFEMSTWVYPAPGRPASPIAIQSQDAGEHSRYGQGSEDFAGLRPYRNTDSPSRIAWKAMAHSDVILSKLFSGVSNREVWLDWAVVQTEDTEQRLSALCAMVLESRRQRIKYGLRLPGRAIEPDIGAAHDRRCLEALAQY